MNPRRVLTAAVVLASAGALTAVTIPAFAGTDRAESPVGSLAQDPDLDPATPQLLAALTRDLGLSAEQAADRLATEAWAAETAAALGDELGPQRYAGAWLTGDATALRVAVTDADAADQVRAAGAQPRLVRYGQADLAEVKETLDAHAAAAADPVTGWYVDPATNSVVVLAPDWAESQAWAFADDSGVPTGAVRVVASDEAPRPLVDLRGGDAYIIAGASRCSVGFPVVDGSGNAGFVTAGHCALAGETTTGLDGLPQGEFVAASFPGVDLNGPDDWGVVDVNEDWEPLPVVNDFQGGVLPVAGAEVAPVGASVCKSGSTTGVSCGLILATDTTVIYPQGIVSGLTRTDVCAEPGDSGGSWLAGDQAQGVTSGGSGDCTAGGVTFFQPLAEVLDLTGLNLVTTDGTP